MFLRSRRRSRLRRVASGAAIAFGVLLLFAVVSRIVGDEGAVSGTDLGGQVRFTGSVRSVGVPAKPETSRQTLVARDLHRMLERLYEDAFVGRAGAGGGFDAAARRFVGDAALGFVEDQEALTLGPLLGRVVQANVEEAVADLTLYFESDRALAATAQIRFAATTALPDDAGSLEVTQSVFFVLERREEGWFVTSYYDAEQRRRAPDGALPDGVPAESFGVDRPPRPAEPTFVLVVGTALDAEPRISAVERLWIAGIDPARSKAGVLEIPVETWVEIPEHGVDELATAINKGDLPLLTQTVATITGCTFTDTILASEPTAELLSDTTRIRDALRAGETFSVLRPSLLPILAAIRKHTVFSVDPLPMLQLLESYLALPVESVRPGVVQTRTTTVDGLSVLQITTEGQEQFVDLCGDGAYDR